LGDILHLIDVFEIILKVLFLSFLTLLNKFYRLRPTVVVQKLNGNTQDNSSKLAKSPMEDRCNKNVFLSPVYVASCL